ncbi:MAG: PAS-domain containing protein [Bauldia sp.]|nr:PAS-domain containing protein [Bauldia sp.]
MAPAPHADASSGWLAPILSRLAGNQKTVSGHARLLIRPSYQRLVAAEPVLRRAIPVLIVVFLGIVAATRYVQLSELRVERDVLARENAAMIVAVIAEELNAAEPTLSDATFRLAVQDALAAALPSGALRDGRRLYVVDPSGTILATAPHQAGEIGRDVAAMVGQAQPLMLFGVRAGVLDVALGGTEAGIAAARVLEGRLGAVIVAQPAEAILRDWRAQVSLNVLIFVGTSAILLVILYGYFTQSSRANEADRIYSETHKRVDAALVRGRCGLWDWDLASGRIFWSQSMFEIVGHSPRDALLGFGEVNGLVHPDDGDLLSIAEHLYESGDTTVDRLFRMRHTSGGWIWVRVRAELVGEDGEPHLIGICVDTTEQIRQAERTMTADIRLRDAIETISEAFVLWDAENRLVMCNSKYQQLYALPDEAMRAGLPYAEVMAAGRQPVVLAQVPSPGAIDARARSFEALLEDGRWLQINERQTKDGGFVSVGTDITTIKRHEEQLVEQQRELTANVLDLRQSRQTQEQQTQKMVELADKYAEEKDRAEDANRTKSAFLANISHELRTPLNAIIGFSEVMQSGMFGALGSPKYAAYCKDIHDSGTYLLGVINDILDMSRIEAGRLSLETEPLDLSEMVDEAIRVAAQASGNELTVTDDVADGLAMEGDRRAMKQILLNLLSNAAKFTPTGGRVTVRARRCCDAVVITVADSGIGIPRDALAKLGKPFEQVQNQFTKSHKGSGLGLAITRSLAELHGGAMRIFSREGVGTIVSVRLPARQPAPQAESDAA